MPDGGATNFDPLGCFMQPKYSSILGIALLGQGPPTLPPTEPPTEPQTEPTEAPTEPASGRNVVHSTYENPTQLQWDCMASTSVKKKEDPIVSILPPKSTGGACSSGGVCVERPTFTNSTLTIRPPLWTDTPGDSTFRIRAEDYGDAQYIADALYYYIGREPIYFCDANLQYPPLCLGNRILSTREMCRAYVESISTYGVRKYDLDYEITLENIAYENKTYEDTKYEDPKLERRKDYIKRVKALVLEVVTSPEAVLFLRSFRSVAVVRPTFKNPTVVIRPPKWTGSTFRMRAATYEEAQYIADAVLYYIGREPIYFREGYFQYPPLCLGTCTLLTREMCRDYVESISQIKGPALQRQRRSYMESVKDLVLTAVKSPEVVLILRSLRSISYSTTHLGEIQDGRIDVDGNNAASTERKSHISVNDDDDQTVHVGGLTGIGSDWFDWGIIPLTEHKTSSSMKGFVITLEGFLSTLDEDLQSSCAEEINSRISEGTASSQEYQQNAGDTSQGSDQQSELLFLSEYEVADAMTITERDLELGINQQHELFTFPEGEADAVTITKRDMESLQPMMYLSDTIIDFYIKYLERKLSTEDKLRSYFFNSFFFTTLLGNNSASTDLPLCEVDYAQVRKWTRKVNLFDKDYIFIPLFRSAHWSLIIISHLSSLVSSPGKTNDSPCIFHLDSVEGMHEGVERQVRSYVYQACREMYQASNKKEEMLLAVASRMKYVQAKVPQQDNGSDCGLYILQYVETFLFEPPCFRLASSKWGAHFTREVSGKRMAIQRHILRMSQEQAVEIMDIPDLNQKFGVPANWGGRIKHMQNYGSTIISDGQVAGDIPLVYPSTSEGSLEIGQQQPKVEIRKRSTPPTTSPPQKRRVSAACALPSEQNYSKKWSDKETSELLSALLGGHFCRGKRGGMRWDDVNIEDSEGRMRTKAQCQNRYDSLSKAYKSMKDYIDKTGKPFSEITEKERRDMKLATPLSEKWYMDLDEYRRRPHNVRSLKRAKLNSVVDIGPRSSS